MTTETKVEAVAWQYRLKFGDDRSWRTALGSLNADYDRDSYEIRALVPASALDALRGEVAAAERRVAELRGVLSDAVGSLYRMDITKLDAGDKHTFDVLLDRLQTTVTKESP